VPEDVQSVLLTRDKNPLEHLSHTPMTVTGGL